MPQARTRRRQLNHEQALALKPRPSRAPYPDPELVRGYIRPNQRSTSYGIITRDGFGRQLWHSVGVLNHTDIEELRAKAREMLGRVKDGKPATEPPPPPRDSFADVSENWMRRHVEKEGLISAHEIERCLKKYVLPHWGDRPFVEIKRSDVAKLLDHIEDEHGARQADAVLTIIRSICSWYATRDDNYVVPIVKKMKRSKSCPRERILTDDEIPIVWRAAEEGGAFGALLQLALLTAQREAKLLQMRWSSISADGVWTVPVKEREKGTGRELVLPELARAILRRLPRVHGSDLVFVPANGGQEMSPSHRMEKFRAALPEGFPHFVIHDLRRTWRSLASKAGVNPDHAERVMGHVIRGVEGVYDRYSYVPEKQIALEKVAVLIEQIISSEPSEKIVPMRARS
jgi:integrase